MKYPKFKYNESPETIITVLSLCISDSYYQMEHRLNRVLSLLDLIYNPMVVKCVLSLHGFSLSLYGDITLLRTICLDRYGVDIKDVKKENENV